MILINDSFRFNLGSAFSGEESSEEEEEDDEDAADPMQPEVKSSFEQRQERLKSRIEDLENEAIGPKPWQLAGETSRDLRPDNALLEEDLYFDHTTRVAPVITEETTRTLEDLIKQRIKDQAFDDVERKVKPVYDPSEYKKKLVLDQEKSKFSLAEIYEQVTSTVLKRCKSAFIIIYLLFFSFFNDIIIFIISFLNIFIILLIKKNKFIIFVISIFLNNFYYLIIF